VYGCAILNHLILKSLYLFKNAELSELDCCILCFLTSECESDVS